MESLQNLATLSILNTLSSSNSEKRKGIKTAISASDTKNFIRNTLKRGVKTSRGGTNTKNLVQHKYLKNGKARTNYVITIPDKELYNYNSMPRGNVRGTNPHLVMTEANYRRHGGHYKLPVDTEGTSLPSPYFGYVPMQYTRNGTMRYPPPFDRMHIDVMRHHGYNLNRPKPPAIRPPAKFTMSLSNKSLYNKSLDMGFHNWEPYYYATLNNSPNPNPTRPRKKKKQKR
tara:strand:+ start:1101 stop:1787 length:687 start_codon:yes stop_codon:yes gene_type:complete